MGPEGYAVSEQVPFEARQAIQMAIWRKCIRPADNAWITWSDAVVLADTAARALIEAGYEVRLIDDSASVP